MYSSTSIHLQHHSGWHLHTSSQTHTCNTVIRVQRATNSSMPNKNVQTVAHICRTDIDNRLTKNHLGGHCLHLHSVHIPEVRLDFQLVHAACGGGSEGGGITGGGGTKVSRERRGVENHARALPQSSHHKTSENLTDHLLSTHIHTHTHTPHGARECVQR